MRTGQRNPSRASSARSGRPRSASPAQEPVASDGVSAEAHPPAGRPAGAAHLPPTCRPHYSAVSEAVQNAGTARAIAGHLHAAVSPESMLPLPSLYSPARLHAHRCHMSIT